MVGSADNAKSRLGIREKTMKSSSIEKDRRTLSASQPQSVSDDRGFSQIARLSETSDTPTTSRRRHSKSTKSASTLEDFALMGSLGSVGTSRSPLSIQKYKNYTNMPSTSNPACMSTITGSSGIYGVPDRVRDSNTLESRRCQKAVDDNSKPKNYHIKSIRKGVPEIMSTNRRGQTQQIPTKKIEITPYCVCQRSSNRKKTSKAWAFSILTGFLCVFCPILSFSADSAFYSVCNSHYKETAQLLDFVRAGNFQTATARVTDPTNGSLIQRISDQKDAEKNSNPAPLRHKRDLSYIQDENSDQDAMKKTRRHQAKQHVIRHAKTQTNPLRSSVVSGEHVNPVPTCHNSSVLRAYIATPDAEKRLEAVRHMTSDVFLPVLVIGSFPSFLLCIFARIVVMITGHDHFLSAFVISIVGMSLQLVTGALSAHSAAYHIGPYGFSCWKCIAAVNCDAVGALDWIDDSVSVSLMVATATKIFDGLAGGMVLFVVVLRIMWRNTSHHNVWWYISRYVSSAIALILCLAVPTAMLITPAVGLFRFQFLEKTAPFSGRDQTLFALMIIFGAGLASWGVYLSTLCIYLIYKTCLYCRMKEHIAHMM
ncbi:uncharacterized protein LOC143471215 [Clavelina lepadiformis]|uniref:Uncharacterized protein n=1 Tax=Clavelina lepadiformis TaxID=159417 RepID=A0ABP0FGM6_CLALP